MINGFGACLFMVNMIHYENPSLQSIGYLFVEVENINSSMIIIGYIYSFIYKNFIVFND